MIVLVRHGRTAVNAQGRLQGHIDEPLDAEGERQAAAIGRLLGPVDAVITSPLRRARGTAAHIDGPLEVDERWIEMDYGVLDGTPTREVPVDVWRRWRNEPGFAPEGGESIATLTARVGRALDDLAPTARDRTVVVVTHVSPIKAAVVWTLGGPPEMSWRIHVDQASISRITVGPNGPALQGFNDLGHLG